MKKTSNTGLVQSWVAASSAAWGWQSSKSGATIPKSFGFEAATRYGATNQCYPESDLFEPCPNTSISPWGFSLAEVLAALVIAAMVLVTVLAIYSRAESSAAAITRRLDSSRLPSEVLQRIAEDLDRIITSDADTRIAVNNKFEKGYQTAKLTITKTVRDGKDKVKVFEEIVWQTNYDYDANSLVLYRRRTSELGLLEDKLLDESRESWEEGLFVPICDGITFFKAQVVRDGEIVDRWGAAMPPGIDVTISFAPPFKTLANTLDVPDEQKFTRTIAIDRTRQIRFKIEPKEQEQPEDNLTKRAEEIRRMSGLTEK